jgi:hypothetical protein
MVHSKDVVVPLPGHSLRVSWIFLSYAGWLVWSIHSPFKGTVVLAFLRNCISLTLRKTND